jgi:hypothetical protein
MAVGRPHPLYLSGCVLREEIHTARHFDTETKLNLDLNLRRFYRKLNPRAVANGSGSTNSAGCTNHQLDRPILRSNRGHIPSNLRSNNM